MNRRSDRQRRSALAFPSVALRSSGVWPPDVCFHDRDNATLPALTAGLSRSTEGRASPLALAGSRGCEPEQAGRHFGGAGASPREAAVLCPDAGSELHRLPHHRGDTAVSRPRRDEWSSPAAALSPRWGRACATPSSAAVDRWARRAPGIVRSARSRPWCRPEPREKPSVLRWAQPVVADRTLLLPKVAERSATGHDA